MTWIVGAAPPIGYAVGISDVRVTFEDGSERDCLQKIYPISRFIAAGFAGSVRIGFAMVEALTSHLRDLPEGAAWFPDDVADDLAALAKKIFGDSETEEQALHSDLMLLGAHPTDDVGIPGYARCSVHILRSPDFLHEQRTGEVVSIGSGSGITRYQEVLADIDVLSLIRGEIMGGGMGFLPISLIMQKTVEKYPAPGISEHTHICVVRRGMVQMHTNDENRYPPSGEKIEIRMPPVATTWDEFVRMVSSESKSPHGTVC